MGRAGSGAQDPITTVRSSFRSTGRRKLIVGLLRSAGRRSATSQAEDRERSTSDSGQLIAEVTSLILLPQGKRESSWSSAAARPGSLVMYRGPVVGRSRAVDPEVNSVQPGCVGAGHDGGPIGRQPPRLGGWGRSGAPRRSVPPAGRTSGPTTWNGRPAAMATSAEQRPVRLDAARRGDTGTRQDRFVDLLSQDKLTAPLGWLGEQLPRSLTLLKPGQLGVTWVRVEQLGPRSARNCQRNQRP